MDVVRYRPGEAIRWLATGAQNLRKEASNRGRVAVGRATDARGVADNLMTAAGALVDLGKSAYTELLHHQAEAFEYVLMEDRFDVVRGGTIRSIPYSEVRSIEYKGERASIQLEKNVLVIKPVAHIVAGHARVPVGWRRNDTEVPYELLIEELAARSKCELQS